jgi:hypothetical protein
MVKNAGVAQLVEQRFRKARAGGSIPLAGFFKTSSYSSSYSPLYG